MSVGSEGSGEGEVGEVDMLGLGLEREARLRRGVWWAMGVGGEGRKEGKLSSTLFRVVVMKQSKEESFSRDY